MTPHISLLTLGVADLAMSRQFYAALGFSEIPESQESIAFFATSSGMLLGLYDRQALAEDTGVQLAEPGGTAFTLAHNVTSPAAVDSVLAEAVTVGATLVKAGQPVFWGGYSGYFADPDGFLWEVAYNPFMDLTGGAA
ncbi:VOC family protein [Chitinilyticum piscinae]|uniref:VOC family protein n=1 Tax=Chitinilyticum piscinae TaxID=2866724 RepID=A0A8J7FLD2_9NEIS|nr:VOC family protein [Chitinilyticum piscinae]MBE9608401.1 VOC family protein [Chitinilyticum piscinae]